jgi:hypothetical protein
LRNVTDKVIMVYTGNLIIIYYSDKLVMILKRGQAENENGARSSDLMQHLEKCTKAHIKRCCTI